MRPISLAMTIGPKSISTIVDFDSSTHCWVEMHNGIGCSLWWCEFISRCCVNFFYMVGIWGVLFFLLVLKIVFVPFIIGKTMI